MTIENEKEKKQQTNKLRRSRRTKRKPAYGVRYSPLVRSCRPFGRSRIFSVLFGFHYFGHLHIVGNAGIVFTSCRFLDPNES